MNIDITIICAWILVGMIGVAAFFFSKTKAKPEEPYIKHCSNWWRGDCECPFCRANRSA